MRSGSGVACSVVHRSGHALEWPVLLFFSKVRHWSDLFCCSSVRSGTGVTCSIVHQ